MEEQRKFQRLKARLEGLNYRFPFTIESQELIEALLNDLTELNTTLGKPQQLTLGSPGFQYSERIQCIDLEKQRLEEEIYNESWRDTQYISPEMFRRRLLNADDDFECNRIELFENQKKKLGGTTGGQEKSRRNLNFESDDRLHKENKYLQEKIKGLDRLVAILRRELDLSIATIKEINSGKEIGEEYEALKEVIKEFRIKDECFEEEILRLKGEYLELVQYNTNLEQQVSNLGKELGKCRSELEFFGSVKAKLTSEIESLSRQVDLLQNENSNLHSLRDEDQQLMEGIEKKYYEIEKCLKSEVESSKFLMRENKDCLETIKKLKDSFRQNEKVKESLAEEVKYLEGFVSKYETSVKDKSFFIDLAQNTNLEAQGLKNSIEKLVDSNEDLKLLLSRKISEEAHYKITIEKYHSELAACQKQLSLESQSNERLLAFLKSAEQNRESLEKTKFQFQESSARERQLHLEIDQLTAILSKTEEKLSLSQNLSERLQSDLKSFEEKNFISEKKLEGAILSENSRALELNKAEAVIKQKEVDIRSLTNRVIEIERKLESVEDELADKGKAYMEEREHVKRQNEQIMQLNSFIQSLESSISSSSQQIESLKASEAQKEMLLDRLKSEINSLTLSLNSSEYTLASTLAQKSELMCQIDSISLTLKSRTEALSNIQSSESLLKKNWRDNEIEKMRLQEANSHLTLQLTELKQACDNFQTQLYETSKEYTFNDTRFKDLEERYKDAINDRDIFKKKFQEVSSEFSIKQENYINAVNDREEISQRFRVLSEKYNLVVREFEGINTDYQQILARIERYEACLVSTKRQEEVYMRRAKDLEEELRRTIRELELCELRKLEAERTLEGLAQEVSTTKSCAREIEFQRDDLGRRLSAVEAEKLFFQSKFRARELDLAHQLIN